MKTIYLQFLVHWLRISLLAAIAATSLLFVTTVVTSAHAVSARQEIYVATQLAPGQLLRGGGGGHSSGSHSSGSHSTSSHSSSSSSSSRSSGVSHTYSHTTYYSHSSSSSPLDWSSCLTLLVTGAIILIVFLVVRNRRN